jgi:hypothetical protein
MLDEELRSRLADSLKNVSVPRPDIEQVYRRGSPRRRTANLWRLRAGWAAAAVVLLAGILIPLMILLPIGRSPEPANPTQALGRTLAAMGIELTIPEGWDGRIYAVNGYSRPVFRIATFPLPESDDVDGSRARAMMQKSDVLIAITEYSAVCPPCAGFAQASFPLRLSAEDFETPFDVWHDIPPQNDVVPASHDLARETFETNDRFLDLWIEFGQEPASAEMVSAAGRVVESLKVGDFAPPLHPDGLCNEWSLQKDPDCPQTIWIKSVLSEAGFGVIDSPGESTLVGEGAGATFYIWVREPVGSLAETKLPHNRTVEGVRVYGTGSLVWRTQGLEVRIAPGPEDGNRIPDGQDLVALVRATLGVPYPPE